MREGIGSRRYGKLGAAVMAFALVCGVVPSAPAEELTDDDFRVRVSAALLLGYSDNKDPGKVILNSNYLEGGGSGSAASDSSVLVSR